MSASKKRKKKKEVIIVLAVEVRDPVAKEVTKLHAGPMKDRRSKKENRNSWKKEIIKDGENFK